MLPRQFSPVVAIAVITAVCLTGDSMLYIALPVHWRDVGLTSLVEVGVLLSVNRFVRLPLNPFIGWLYQRISVKRGLTAAVFLGGVTTLLYGFATGFWTWVVLRCCWGLAWSLFRIGAYSVILDVSTDENRGSFMGRYNGLYRIGSLIGMFAGGVLADLFGIRLVAIGFGAAALTVGPLLLSHVCTVATDAQPTRSLADFLRHLRKFTTVWTFVTGFLLAVALEGMLTATLSYTIGARYIDVSLGQWTAGAATVAGFLQAVRWTLGPWLSPWIGRVSDGRFGRPPVVVGVLLIAVALLLLVPTPLPPFLWLAVLLALLLVSTLLTTLTDALASDVASHSARVTLMTGYTMVVDVGAALGPTLGYSLIAGWGMASLYLSSAVVMFGLMTGWLWIILQKRNSSAGAFRQTT